MGGRGEWGVEGGGGWCWRTRSPIGGLWGRKGGWLWCEGWGGRCVLWGGASVSGVAAEQAVDALPREEGEGPASSRVTVVCGSPCLHLTLVWPTVHPGHPPSFYFSCRRARLSPTAYAVLRTAATERAGSSPLDKEYRAGTFSCAGCGTPLYTTDGKFDSGTGWPSFFRALPDGGVSTRASVTDVLLRQKEVVCGVCGGHLGHVFKDGPPPTGLRYCMNGVAMAFTPKA